MSGAFLPLWALFLGAVSLFTLAVVRGIRRNRDSPAPRSMIALVALGCVGTSIASTLILSVIPASAGARRIRANDHSNQQTMRAKPAQARLFLRHVRTDTSNQRVGYSPTADLLLPALYRLTESERAWDLFSVTSESSPKQLTITTIPPPTPTSTRLHFQTFAAPPSSAALSVLARHCRTTELPPAKRIKTTKVTGAIVAVALCRGSRPRAVLTFEEANGSLVLTPSVWRRGRLEPHHIEIEARKLVQIGASTAAVPGVTLWEVPSPRHRSELFSAPDNLLGDCAEFAHSVFAPKQPDHLTRGQTGAVCAVPFAPPFALEVRRLVPDVSGISARVIWMCCLLLAPLLGWATGLLASRRLSVTHRELGALTRFAVVTTAVIALFASRLLWAHRIDMLRDWTALGERTLGNIVSIYTVFLGFSLYAVIAATRNHSHHRLRWILATIGFAIAMATLSAPANLGGTNLGGLWTRQWLGQWVLAGLLGSVTMWKPHLEAGLSRAPARAAVVIGLLAAVTALAAPRAVAIKLLLVTVAIVICYRVIRRALAASQCRDLHHQDQQNLHHRRGSVLDFLAVFFMIAALARLDTGLTAIFVVPGFFVAIALAGHDALFGPQALAEVKSFSLRGYPLIRAQGGLLFLFAMAMAGWALWGLARGVHPSMATQLTAGAPHLLLITAALFAAPALIAQRRSDQRTATVFAVAAATVVCTWLLRDTLAEWVLSSSAPAAQRYAVIADPGYALLADPSAFLSGITGWAETIFGTSSEVITGSGYFGAQLIDPGVLLSVENDYLPILMLRELGVIGITMTAVTSLAFVFTAWLCGREHTPLASPQARSRLALLIVVVIAMTYQPLAALGTLPLTGVSWLGFGVDSPADVWMLISILVYLSAIDLDRHSPPRASVPATDTNRYERSVRLSGRFIRQERWIIVAVGLAIACAVLLIAKAAVFAGSRPQPVGPDGAASEPFAGLEGALDYARGLHCTQQPNGHLGIRGNPTNRGTQRYHRRLTQVIDRFNKNSHNREENHRITVGLITIVIRPETKEKETSGCRVILDRRALAALRVRPAHPYEKTRVRLTSKPMGIAARDHGELVSGNVVVRLRATAGDINAPTAPGLYAGRSIDLGAGITLQTTDGGVVSVERADEGEGNTPNEWLFVAKKQQAGVGIRPKQENTNWHPVLDRGDSLVLHGDALIVVGSVGNRNVWLYRSATSPPIARNNAVPGTTVTGPAVGSLLADDAQSISGSRRRLYIYGNELPELGWVNPYRRRGSVGLDGWVNTAISEWNPNAPPTETDCGTLAPQASTPNDACSWNEHDQVLDCQVTLQPELSIRMRHLTEMIAAAPIDFAPELGDRIRRPLRASFVVLRGDSGEIAAQGSFVPGRASPAYSPTTRALETHLIRLREDRDPKTGIRLPTNARGEASAEKVEYNRPIAIGSVFKPMMARAFEQTAPTLARRLLLVGNPSRQGRCRQGKVHAIFGHCPATDSLWNLSRPMDMESFLSQSSNWTLAALALLGTALPDGQIGLGQSRVNLEQLLATNVGDHSTKAALWTQFGGEQVVGSDHKLNPKALATTPMWQRFEALLGRKLCTDGSKARCRQKAFRRDVCATRALPIASPSSDLRQLVSLGPSNFDFYPHRNRKTTRIPTREYLQFLRGSGVHPVGTLAQITDAFNRVVYEASRDPIADGPYQLAASWFPAHAVGEIPATTCRNRHRGTPTERGVCAVVTHGTATKALAPVIADHRVEIYGAKTGTIDSLGDIAARDKSCKRYRDAHTLTDRRRVPESQPYWLECGKEAKTNDSLLVLSIAIKGRNGQSVPLTIGLSFVRSGGGFAAHVAHHYVDILVEYFGVTVESGLGDNRTSPHVQ